LDLVLSGLEVPGGGEPSGDRGNMGGMSLAASLIESLSAMPDQLDERLGLVPADALVHYLASHDQQHLACMH
jgi:hypothetical protein